MVLESLTWVTSVWCKDSPCLRKQHLREKLWSQPGCETEGFMGDLLVTTASCDRQQHVQL